MKQPWQLRERDMPTNNMPLQAPRKGKKTSFRHLGALLTEVRRDSGVGQQDIADAFEWYRTKKALGELQLYWPKHLGEVKPLTAKEYGKIERNELAPKFVQLLGLYLAMTAGCGIEITPEEREAFLELAKCKIEYKTRQYRETLSPEDWQWLAEQLSKADGDLERVVMNGQASFLEREQPNEMELALQAQEQEIQRLLQLEKDTRHVLGRESWLEKMLFYGEEQTKPRKKVIIVTAMTGVGKSSCFKLLHKHLLKTENAAVLLHEFKALQEAEAFPSAGEKTPVEHLTTLLAHILNVLQPQQAEKHKAASLKEQINLVLEALCERTTRLVILIDDAQVLLEKNGELSSAWQHFLKAVMEHEHHGMLYVATREWPGWTEREDTYIAQTKLEPLTPEVCVQLWKNLGFGEEPADILQRATALCDGNPRMMEIVAQHVEKPIYSFGWANWHEATKASRLQGLARFVDDPHCFSNTVLYAFPLLDEIITTRLAPDVQQLLALLAVAPVPLPAPLLTSLAEHPKRCIKALVRTSLLAQDPERLQLLPLVTESTLQQLSQEERTSIEKRLISTYRHWMEQGNYRSEQEQATVIAELAILHLKHHQLLEAAELVIGYGWLLYAVCQALRVARIADSSVRSLQLYSEENEAGSLLLRLRLMRFFKKTGQILKVSKPTCSSTR